MSLAFIPFPKIARLNREIVITEKIDGTNACVVIGDDGEIIAQSRNKIITPGKATDNMGFAGWVEDNRYELTRLGPGRHFGEWWGSGIQRGYGLPKGDKRFSLFNVNRWADESLVPACCGIVPVLYRGAFVQDEIDYLVGDLRENGSRAAPGFAKPEGVIVFHTAAGTLFKVTCENDDKPKGRPS